MATESSNATPIDLSTQIKIIRRISGIRIAVGGTTLDWVNLGESAYLGEVGSGAHVDECNGKVAFR